MKVVLAGPPRSGKSCLREGLKQAIRSISGAPYPYVITGCPDGEGSWFQETVNQDPQLAAQLKAAYKSKFTPEFVNRVSESVTKCSLPLVIIDIGGIPSPENEKICKDATHIVILTGDQSKVQVWRDFATKLGLTVIAEIYSDYNGQEDTIQGDGPILKGSVHHLERGEPVQDRPMVKALAKALGGPPQG